MLKILAIKILSLKKVKKNLNVDNSVIKHSNPINE